MKRSKYILILLAALVLTGCGVKKRTTKSQEPIAESMPAWHTCLIQNARASIAIDGDRFSANVTMQTVHDSMLVISIMPMLGVEMVRLEATPLELTGINKLDGTYATTTYADVNRNLTPTVNWDILQQLCTAELPTGNEHARLFYTLGDKTIEMTVDYPVRKLDVPVRVMHQNVSRYKKIDIRKWL